MQHHTLDNRIRQFAAMDPATTTSTSTFSPTTTWSGDDGDRTVPPSNANRDQPRRVSEAALNRAAVAVACTACRSKHLKCDGQKPCSRCRSETLECSYIKSRRGYKGPRKKDVVQSPAPITPPSHPPVFTLSPEIDKSVLDNSNLATETLLANPGARFPLEVLSTTENHGQIILMPPPAADLPVDSSRIGLINSFYTFFFPAHPFMLPRSSMLEVLQNGNLQHVDAAIQYIGSFYVIGAPVSMLQAQLQNLLSSQENNKDPYFVQAAMLLAMGLHMANMTTDAARTMYSTIQTALGLGMHRAQSPTDISGMNTALEESLRRTWWELYVWDGIFCGVNLDYRLQLTNVPLTMALPIEDSDYVNGRLFHMPQTLNDYEEAAFLNDEVVFSSGTYRIDAVRIIHHVLTATRASPVDEQALDLAETHLANWALHLPESKRKVIDRDGNVDEVLFTAHMIIASCSIMLHRPRSDLSHDDVKSVTTCVNGGPMGITAQNTDLHTAKAMRAARDICVLIKMPCPLVKHTPFFTCAIVMSAVIYLSYWSFMATKEGDDIIKEHIKLNIGSLKTYSTIMPIAKTVLDQVRAVASELFRSRKAMNNVYWGGVSQEAILQNMIEEVSQSQNMLMPAAVHSDWNNGPLANPYGV